MLLECEFLLLKCELMLLKCELMLFKCQINTNTKKGFLHPTKCLEIEILILSFNYLKLSISKTMFADFFVLILDFNSISSHFNIISSHFNSINSSQ